MNEQPTPRLCACGCGQPTKPAPRTHGSRGVIKGEPVAYLLGHAGGRRPRPFDETRWIVEDRGYTTPCWIWQGLKTKGYGHIRRPYSTKAHRYAWTLAHGPIPEGLEIDHLCRQKACVNPDHLEPVTHLENMRRHYRATKSAQAKDRALAPLAPSSDDAVPHTPRGTHRPEACQS